MSLNARLTSTLTQADRRASDRLQAVPGGDSDVLVPQGSLFGWCPCGAPIVYRIGDRPACNECDPIRGASRVDGPERP